MEIKCPYCMGLILSDAKKCQHCWEWIKEKTDTAVWEIVKATKPFVKAYFIYIAIFSVILLALFIYIFKYVTADISNKDKGMSNSFQNFDSLPSDLQPWFLNLRK